MTDAPKPLLRLVQGDAKPKKHRRRDLWQWECHVCAVDIGIKTSHVTKTLLSPIMDGGVLRPRFSTEAWVCLHCLTRGKVTVVV